MNISSNRTKVELKRILNRTIVLLDYFQSNQSGIETEYRNAEAANNHPSNRTKVELKL